MRTTELLLLGALLSVAQAGPHGLRGVSGEKAQVDADLQNSGMANAPEQKEFKRQLEADNDSVDQGNDAVQSIVGGIKSIGGLALHPSWASAGAAFASVGSLVAVAVPPPTGLVANGFMGAVGALMTLFGAKSGPSNAEIIDVVKKGFNTLDIKLENLHNDVAYELELLSDITIGTVLQGDMIKNFNQKVSELAQKLYYATNASDSTTKSIAYADYEDYLNKLATNYAYYAGGTNAALAPKNLDAMLKVIDADSYDNQYLHVSNSVTLYRWFYQARSSLFSILTQSSMMEMESQNVSLLENMWVPSYLTNFAEDAKQYDQVLKEHGLGNTVSFNASHLAYCVQNANSVMTAIDSNLANFMNPYIYLKKGACSHPGGLDNPTVDVLADVNKEECAPGKNSTRPGLVDILPGSNLQFQWLGDCPAGVEPFAQSDVDGWSSCGCRISGSEIKNPDPDSGLIKNGDGLCLTGVFSSPSSGGVYKVVMLPCESTTNNENNQQWEWQNDQQMSGTIIKARNDNSWCLEQVSSWVTMWVCDELSNNQRWDRNTNTQSISPVYQDRETLNYKELCLDASQGDKTDGSVYMTPCDSGNKAQAWSYQNPKPSYVMCKNTCFNNTDAVIRDP